MGINGQKYRSNNTLIDSEAIAAQVEKSQAELVNFSFKYLKEKEDKFIYSAHNGNYFITLKDRLKAISQLRILELVLNPSTALRCHAIDFAATSETCFGIPRESEVVQKPLQFSLSANEDGRVHGFMIKNTFYIVWLDKLHELYP